LLALTDWAMYEGKKEYEKAIESYRQIITTDEGLN
jgi:hypothetical protein